MLNGANTATTPIQNTLYQVASQKNDSSSSTSFGHSISQPPNDVQQHIKSLAGPYLQLAENQPVEEYVHPFGEGITPIGIFGVDTAAEAVADTVNNVLDNGLTPAVVGGAILGTVTRGVGKNIDIPESPKIDPKDIAGKTAPEIDQVAKDSRLIPKGEPTSGKGAYIDPITEKQRVLIHPDPKTGCTGPHCHVNDAEGNRLDIDGKQVPPESLEAHLPLKTD